jgi:phage gpG-like protein
MSEVRIHYEVAGAVQLDRAFTRLAIDIADFTLPLQASEEILEQATRRQFAQQGSPSWKALSPAYARRKARNHPGKTILRLTDALYNSLTRAGSPGAIREITTTLLRFGTSVEVNGYNLGLIHQAPSQSSNMPKRPMLRLNKPAKSLIVNAFRDYFRMCAARRGVPA